MGMEQSLNRNVEVLPGPFDDVKIITRPTLDVFLSYLILIS
jgi:hypothetical protein